MDEPKTNKRVDNSNDSFLGFDDKIKKPTNDIHYEYRFDERETTALDAVYGYLFDKLTEVNQSKDP